MIIRKGEGDKVRVDVNWSSWLGDSSIASDTWEELTGALTISNESNTTTASTAYISGGTFDREYELKNTIITDDAIPRTESRWITVQVVKKTR